MQDDKRALELIAAAEILDAEVKLVFGEGLDPEQREAVLTAARSEAAWLECHAMLDDMEARLGVNVSRTRELVRTH